MRNRTRGVAAAITAAALLGALAACSSDSDTEPSTESPADNEPGETDEQASGADDTEALEQAVAAYINATTTGDTDTAWDALSDRCADAWTREELDGRVGAATAMLPGEQADNINVDELSGDLARVSYTVGTEERAGQPWTREGGTWRFDDC